MEAGNAYPGWPSDPPCRPDRFHRMQRHTATIAVVFVLAQAVPAAAAEQPGRPDPRAIRFFEEQIRPVLADQCFSCHGPKRQKAGLRLDSAAAIRKGGESGPIVAPGDPEQSRLIRAIRHDGDLKMPP